MDVIISAAFGIEANAQDNADDPVVEAARKALTRSISREILLFALSTLPFGTKIMSMFPSILTSNSEQLFKIAEEMVKAKRAGDAHLSRKVLVLCPCCRGLLERNRKREGGYNITNSN